MDIEKNIKKGRIKTEVENKFNKLFGLKLKNLLKKQKGYTLKEVAFLTSVSSTAVDNWYKGSDGLTVYRFFQFIKLLNISDSEIISLFKDSGEQSAQKKEIKQPELVKITEPEPVQKYCGIIKKAYDMQDKSIEIKAKVNLLSGILDNIESDIKKIKREKKENTGESKC